MKTFSRLAALSAFAVFPGVATAAADVGAGRRKAAVNEAFKKGDALWRQIATAEPRPTSGCRQLLGYALALCEARVHPERLERLLALARQMQDQDPHSKNWGNLKWYWRDAGVTDTNAVEFCMQDALLIHIRHGDWLPPAAKQELADLLRLGVEGCLRHRVPTDYTNIAILNAGNLIVLGERLDRADAAREGCRRLDAICAADRGVRGPRVLQSHVLWHGSQRAALDSHLRARKSRAPAGRGPVATLLDRHCGQLVSRGPAAWAAVIAAATIISTAWGAWTGIFGSTVGWNRNRPAARSAASRGPRSGRRRRRLLEMGRRQFPRWVRQHWGILPAECRSQMLYRDIALSCCGAGYGNAGLDAGGRSARRPRTLALLLHSRRPRGSLRKEENRNRFRPAPQGPAHAAVLGRAQRSGDALGLVIYRGRDLAAAEVFHVQSHFVLRRTADIWLDGKRLTMPAGTAEKPAEVPIPAGGSLVLRYGSAAVGVRVPWSYVQVANLPERAVAIAHVSLVDDGNRVELPPADG